MMHSVQFTWNGGKVVTNGRCLPDVSLETRPRVLVNSPKRKYYSTLTRGSAKRLKGPYAVVLTTRIGAKSIFPNYLS